MSEPLIRYMTTAPHPWKSAKKHGADQNQVGWRLHIVKLGIVESGVGLKIVDRSPALCGLRPRHGWALDLFIDEPCARCLKAAERLKIEEPEL